LSKIYKSAEKKFALIIIDQYPFYYSSVKFLKEFCVIECTRL